ncbi:MAG: MATE family efflux transporter [Lachnospiraceae bacterium]|nr:MATE family efflux transporter [Lachnospiraceae bacterium]
MKTDHTELFTSAPVPKAVLALVVPTVISQLITVVYNMADTFFIGQLGDSNQVAAASLALPLFLLTTGMANLFGIGGASLVSRCLGSGDEEKARKTSAFCIWSAALAAFFYGLIMLLFKPYILPAVGTDQNTYGFCYQYLFWTITIGAVPTVLNAALSHLVRAEGYSAQASFGVALGGGLNIILDPVFIYGFKMEIEGAAVATMLSNLIAMLYFIALILKKRKTLHITFDPRCYTLGSHIPAEVLLVGLPSCAMNLMGVFSNIMMNRLMVSYCNEAVAGIGIAKKIDMLAFALANGLSQGVLPLIGYNYSAKNFKRMRSAIKMTLILCLSVTLVAAALLFTCATPIVKAFIDDAETVRYGSVFQRIICITGPFTAITMVIITIFQSVGQKLKPLILSMLRKGGLDVPFMFLMNALAGVNGIAWATPMADCCAMLTGIILFVPFWKKLRLAENEFSEKPQFIL